MSHEPGLRGLMQRHGAIVAVAAVIIAVASVFATTRSIIGPSRQPADLYYYDLNTGDLFTAPGGALQPIAAPSSDADNPSGVRAHVFACGSCDDASVRYVGYITKFNPDVVAKVLERNGGVINAEFHQLLDLTADNTLVRSTESDDDWRPIGSRTGIALVTAAQKRCGNATPARCVP